MKESTTHHDWQKVDLALRQKLAMLHQQCRLFKVDPKVELRGPRFELCNESDDAEVIAHKLEDLRRQMWKCSQALERHTGCARRDGIGWLEQLGTLVNHIEQTHKLFGGQLRTRALVQQQVFEHISAAYADQVSWLWQIHWIGKVLENDHRACKTLFTYINRVELSRQAARTDDPAVIYAEVTKYLEAWPRVDDHDTIYTHETEISAATRQLANLHYGPRAAPEEGEIPDLVFEMDGNDSTEE